MSLNFLSSKGLAFKLCFLFTTCAVLIFVLVITTNYLYSRHKTEGQIKKEVHTTVSSAVNKVESVLNAIEKVPENMSLFFGREDFSETEIKGILCDLLRSTPEIFGISVAFEPYQFKRDRVYAGFYCFRRHKDIVFESFGSDTDKYFYQDWYQITKELQSPQWSEPYLEEQTIMSSYSVPIYGDTKNKKQVIGVIVADISLKWLSDIVQSIKVLKTGYAMLISQNGTIVTHPNRALIMNETLFTIAEELNDKTMREMGREILRKDSGHFENKRLFNVDAYVSFEKIPSNDWRLIVLFPSEEMIQDIKNLNLIVATLGVSGITMLLVMSLFVAKSITRPLTTLSDITEQIGKGHLDTEIPNIKGNDEIARLSVSVSKMRRDLKDYIQQLTKATRDRERIESELRIAHDIQMNILAKTFPPFPDKKEFDLFAMIEPAREVGGDFYDFYLLDRDRICFIVADVSGKGVPAALFMSVTKTFFKVIAESVQTPHQLLNSVNSHLSDNNESSMFVTVCCGILNYKTGELLYANGGHPPPVIIRENTAPNFIEMPDGMVLGIFKDYLFVSASMTLQKGDKIILYTDGVTEAMNHKHDLYGSERLINLLRQLSDRSIQEISRDLMKDIKRFSEDAPQSDDITILCLEYKGG
ncbi:MAG: SpoIIE family protein phosphatase [Thermodesulfovibrionales bacterium]